MRNADGSCQSRLAWDQSFPSEQQYVGSLGAAYAALAGMHYMEQASLVARVSTAHAWITRGHHLFGRTVDSGTWDLTRT